MKYDMLMSVCVCGRLQASILLHQNT